MRPSTENLQVATIRHSFVPSWLLLSLLTTFLWGAWGLQSEIAVSRNISPWLIQFLFPLGFLPTVIWLSFSKRLKEGSSLTKGSTLAFITGILGGTGNLMFYVSMERGGKAAVVTPIVGMAPLITVLVAWKLLRESPTRPQIAGILLASFAGYLLSI